MADPKSPIFRQEALDQLSEARGASTRARLVRPADGAALVALGTLVGLALVWVLFGRVDVRVEGEGLLLRAGAAGSATEALAALSEPALRLQRDQLTDRVARVGERDAASDIARAQEIAVERESLLAQAAVLDARIAGLEGLARSQAQAAAAVEARRRDDLAAQRAVAAALLAERQAELASRERVGGGGAVTRADVAEAREAALDAQQALDAVEQAIAGLPLTSVAAAESHDALVARTSAARAERAEVDRRLIALDRVEAERRADARDARAVIEHQLAAVDLALERQRARADGSEDGAGTAGAGAAAIPAEDPLLVAVFMDAAGAKRVRPGMEIRVSPASVERARYGSVEGVVTEVSETPVSPEQADALLANRALAGTLVGEGRAVLVLARLVPDAETPTGYRWTTSDGPPGALSAGTLVGAQVTVERRRPVTWLLPALRTLLGAEG